MNTSTSADFRDSAVSPRTDSNRKIKIARRGVLYSLLLCGLILLLGGVGFWWLDPRVATLADGLWLAFTTAATVGYGDLVPSTHASRMFSVLVVLLGLAVLSLATASLAAIFVEQDVEAEERQIERELMDELQHLHTELKAIKAEIALLRTETRQDY
jgi:voltage-gated potassium channel